MALDKKIIINAMNGNIKRTYERYWNERIKESTGGDKSQEISNEIFDTASSALKERE